MDFGFLNTPPASDSANDSSDPLASNSRASSPTSLDDWEDELPKEQRIDLAYEAWKEANGGLSQTRAAEKFGISRTTLEGRIHGATSRAKRNQSMQRLKPFEEESLVKWITRLQTWGWPARIEQTRFMAEAILQARGDTKKLGINWIQKFLGRHEEIKTKYLPPLDKERALATTPGILNYWFNLYHDVKTEFGVTDENVWNMDEKGFLQGQQGKIKVLLNKYLAKKSMTQCGNREWTTTIEAVSLAGRRLRPWVIFKGVQKQVAWADAYPEAHITTSENGWTNNEIGLDWFQVCFDPETTPRENGAWRILILDGHASHISTKTIEFCVGRRIILLCLPAHTTHILQPLDVGIFAALQTSYRHMLQKTTRLGAGYKIDKCDFLRLFKKARNETVTPENIVKAWEASGLSPFNPELIIQQFRTDDDKEASKDDNYTVVIRRRPSTPPTAIITHGDYDGGVQRRVCTPHNSKHIEALMDYFLSGEGDAEILKEGFEKVSHFALKACTEVVIEKRTYSEILDHLQIREGKKERRKGTCDAKVMNQEALNERRDAYEFCSEWTRLKQVHKEVFGRQQKKKPARRRETIQGHRVLNTPSKRAMTPKNSRGRGIRLKRAMAPPSPSPEQATTAEQATTKQAMAKQATTTKQATTKQATTKARRLVVRLRVVVTTKELEQGKWRAQQEQEQPQLGRGHRVRQRRRL